MGKNRKWDTVTGDLIYSSNRYDLPTRCSIGLSHATRWLPKCQDLYRRNREKNLEAFRMAANMDTVTYGNKADDGKELFDSQQYL